jgi:hypothetical protein
MSQRQAQNAEGDADDFKGLRPTDEPPVGIRLLDQPRGSVEDGEACQEQTEDGGGKSFTFRSSRFGLRIL